MSDRPLITGHSAGFTVGKVEPATGEQRAKEEKFLEDFKAHYGYERKWRTLQKYLNEMNHDNSPYAKAELTPGEVLELMKKIENEA